MAKEASDRFQSAAEFRRAIREAEYALQPGTATGMTDSRAQTDLSRTPVAPDPDDVAATVLETASPPASPPPAAASTQTAAIDGEPTTVAESARRPWRWQWLGSVSVLLILLGLGLLWWSGWPDTELPSFVPPVTEEPAQSGEFGLVRFQETADSYQLSLWLERVVAPPTDSQYVLWGHDSGSDHFEPLASFSTDNGLVHLAQSPDGPLLGEYDRIAISRTNGSIEMSGSFDPELTELIIGLTTAVSLQEKGAILGAVEQVELATQHADFMRQSLAEDDLVEAKRHAEHVVNILDGEDGEFFGDVDGDGVVDPLRGEGGLNAAARYTFKLAEVTIVPISP